MPVVCIDCSPLLVQSAGVKTYLFHWLNALRAANPEAIRAFLEPGPPDLNHEGGFRLHPRQLRTLFALNALPSLFCSLAAPRCDIFHASNQLRSIPRRRLLTATLHDLTAWVVPDCHMPETVIEEKAFAGRVLKRADGLIADSENSKRDAIAVLDIPPDRIRVIYPGVPRTYASVPSESVARVANAFALHRPYFLSVGTIEPRKNIDTLLTAWESLPPSFRSEYELILTGMPGWRSDLTIARLRQANSAGHGIRYLGYVPEPDMPPLTAGATAFLYPSLYEGFGLPVVQAMLAGCPVVTSNVSSLPEITGDASLLIDPRSAAELSAAIRCLGESTGLREQLKARGIEQAKRFTWEKTAAESLEYFREIA